jgi:hypothetical protein
MTTARRSVLSADYSLMTVLENFHESARLVSRQRCRFSSAATDRPAGSNQADPTGQLSALCASKQIGKCPSRLAFSGL